MVMNAKVPLSEKIRGVTELEQTNRIPELQQIPIQGNPARIPLNIKRAEGQSNLNLVRKAEKLIGE